ncbi:TetR family transcriptional regulator [[Pantoea] beijingensis]|uniref:TetR family transcriptional regulator n=1 Tax=[Pantoea] beijingensis TaxID=1324864 RepID=A0A443IB61_9GAMM|nr:MULTISPECIES: TetR/AcrR family transcriptional regulator [Erwiniaceae]RWR01329.1 TetR family transcriptional regulator [[Pantoea] beijingensis]
MLLPDPFDPKASAAERIINSAQQLFYQNGIRATGVDKIIANAGVTKVTFYRHFAAKDDLVLTFLRRRHLRWMDGFQSTLEQALCDAPFYRALPAALLSWFREESFRGCAFINVATELADTLPAALEIVQQHKQAMQSEITRHLPAHQQLTAETIAMLVDGAVVQVQIGKDAEKIVRQLELALGVILGA